MDQKGSTPDPGPPGRVAIRNVGRPLIVGEVLFDVMPDGTRVLGGAPFNVAWHLAAFGLRPLMITRIGVDGPGDDVLAAMDAWGMGTSGVQYDRAYPTGEVRVSLDGGEPSFQILPDQAYDHLDADAACRAVGDEAFPLLYHGSLIARAADSRSAVGRLREVAGAPVFVDVNLRDPWWNRTDVLADVSRATWVKVNQAELGLLAAASDRQDAGAFRAEYGLEAVIVTRSADGALVAHRGGSTEAGPPGDVDVVDTVGAGDAFSSVFILGLMQGWTLEQTLERALEFAAAICTVPGATVRDRGFYAGFSAKGWW